MSSVSDNALKDVARALKEQNRILDAININLVALVRAVESQTPDVIHESQIAIPGSNDNQE